MALELQFSCGAKKTGYEGSFVEASERIGKLPESDGRIRVMVYGADTGPWVIPAESKLDKGWRRPHCLHCPCKRASGRREIKVWPKEEPPTGRMRLDTMVSCLAQEVPINEDAGGECAATRVVNVRREACDVYIGRRGAYCARLKIPLPALNLSEADFGNPFAIKGDSERDRQEAIALYERYFLERVEKDTEFRAAALALRGKRLGCWCAPLPCHGDVIVEWLGSQASATPAGVGDLGGCSGGVGLRPQPPANGCDPFGVKDGVE